MSNAIVSNVYRYVIDDVINQVRGDFEDMGIDDSILQELQRSWESKVARSRVANFGFKEDGYYEDDANNNSFDNNNNANNNNTLPSVNNLNEQGYPQDYQPSPASLANLAVNSMNNRPPASYGLPPPNTINRVIPDPNTLVNRYQMPPNNNNNNNNNLPELQLPGISRQNLPQNDGGNDMTTQDIDNHIQDIIQSSQQEEFEFTASNFSGEPLALDSLPESVKELMKEAKQRAIQAGALSKKTRIPQLDGEGDETQNNDDDINSDLDDSDEDEEDGEGGEEIEHIILCLYDKVSRTKNKWKCVLKDGIMLVNGRDYLFHRANGDFEW